MGRALARFSLSPYFKSSAPILHFTSQIMRPYTKLPSNTCHKFLQTKTLGKLPKMPSTQLRIKQRAATRNQGTKGQEPHGISLMGANVKSTVSSCRNRALHQKEYLLLKLSSQGGGKKKVNGTLNINIHIHTQTHRHVVYDFWN